MSIRDWLTEAKEAGLDSIPGTAAEILDDEVRWVLTKGKLPTATWIEVVTTAHELGMPSQLDDDVRPRRPARATGSPTCAAAPAPGPTGGFTEFVPLPFIHHNAPVYLAGLARPGPDAARQPGGARDGPAAAARRDRQHPDLLGQARRRRRRGDAARRRQRPRRHADGGDDQPDGRLASTARARPSPSSRRSPAAAGRPARQRTTTYGAGAARSGAAAAAPLATASRLARRGPSGQAARA